MWSLFCCDHSFDHSVTWSQDNGHIVLIRRLENQALQILMEILDSVKVLRAKFYKYGYRRNQSTNKVAEEIKRNLQTFVLFFIQLFVNLFYFLLK